MKGRRKDISGQRFGRLVAVRLSDRPSRRSLWECKCDCGKQHEVLAQSLIAGIQKSCGCLRNEVAAVNGKATATHGMTRTPKWNTWNRMIRGASKQGIAVCLGLKSHPNALFKALPGKPSKATVVLLDGSGGFTCGDCSECVESGKQGNIAWGKKLRSDRKCKIDLTGMVFNQLTAIEYVKDGKWMFQCKCGRTTIAESKAVKSGFQKSCGCLKAKTAKQLGYKRKTHGMSHTSIGSTWSSMKFRCYNAKSSAYKYYGGRGIVMCEFLKRSPSSIRTVIGRRISGTSIDRIDNNGSYTCGVCNECAENGWPKNIRWATSAEQARNTRRNRMVTIYGKTMCLRDWAAEIGIGDHVLSRRIRLGMSDYELVQNRKTMKQSSS